MRRRVNQTLQSKLFWALLSSLILVMNLLVHPHTDILTSQALQLSRTSLWVCLLAGPVLLSACSSTPKTIGDIFSKKTTSGTDEQIFIENSTEQYYHPNVMMKRGEAYFEKEEYAEALIEYNRFLEFYRNHVLASYAAFRIGEVHMKMAKSVDRDPEPMQKAIVAFERVKKEFPGSRYDAQSQEKLEECHNWLAEMHLFVGRFYYRRGSYLAAAHRFEQIMRLYPDRPVAPDALYFLAMSYHEMGADDWARERLILLADTYPDSKAAGQGSRLLAKLESPQTGPRVAKQTQQAGSSDHEATASIARSLSDLPSMPQIGTLGASATNALGQAFTVCRLGAWC